MKYGWTINQKAAIESGLNIDIIDLSIFEILANFAASPESKKFVDNGKTYYWFKWSWLAAQAPILGLKTRQSVTARYGKLIIAKILEAHPANQITGQAFYCFAENYSVLNFDTAANNYLQGVNKTLQGVNENVQLPVNGYVHPLPTDVYTDKVIINKVIIDKDIPDLKKSDSPTLKFLDSFIAAIEYLNFATGRKFEISEQDRKGKTDKFKMVCKLFVAGYSIEDVKIVVDAKTKEWATDSKMSKHLTYSTLFAARNFEKYLQETKAGQGIVKANVTPSEQPFENADLEERYLKTQKWILARFEFLNGTAIRPLNRAEWKDLFTDSPTIKELENFINEKARFAHMSDFLTKLSTETVKHRTPATLYNYLISDLKRIKIDMQKKRS